MIGGLTHEQASVLLHRVRCFLANLASVARSRAYDARCNRRIDLYLGVP